VQCLLEITEVLNYKLLWLKKQKFERLKQIVRLSLMLKPELSYYFEFK
tara:strand:+ start:1410 stop:1553 length:144 start_codon:yes stop_codon:yes gene_type:complete